MGKPIVFAGSDAKLIVSGDLLAKDGQPYPKAGEKSYVANGSSATGWSTSGVGITVATDTTAADLPRPNTTKTGIKITGVSGSSAYAYIRFTLDPADYNKKLKVQFDQAPVSGYASSDFKVDVYSNTASDYTGTSTRLALSTDSSSVSALPNLTGTYRTTFDTPGSSAKYIEVRIGLNATATSSLVVSDVVVGPGTVTQGAAVSRDVAFTPTGSWTTNTTYTGFYHRVGEWMEAQVLLSLAGAPNSATLTVNMPSGFTINTSALVAQSASVQVVGQAFLLNSGVTNYIGAVIYNSTTNVLVRYMHDTGTAVSNASVTQAAPWTIKSGDEIQITFRVPISEWAGSGTVNVVQNDVEYAYNSSTADSADTSSFGYGPSGVAIGSFTANRKKRVRFKTPIQSTDQLVIQVQKGSGAWVDVGNATYADGLSDLQVQGTKLYGLGFDVTSINSTDIDIVFGDYGYPNSASYAAAGAAWSGYSTYKWRVKKFSGGAAVGFSAATSTSAGLVSTTDQTLAGVKTFQDGLKFDDAAGQSTMNYYATTSATVNIDSNVGGWNAGSVAFTFTRIGNLVTVFFKGINSGPITKTTSTGTLRVPTAIPTDYCPPNNIEYPVIAVVNGTRTVVSMVVGTNGTISIYKSTTQTSWAAADTADMSGFSFSYTTT